MQSKKQISRRSALKLGSLSLAGLGTLHWPRILKAQQNKDKKYIFVIAAAGGASIIDSFLAQSSGPNGFNNLIQINNSPLVAVPPLNNSIQGAIPLGNGYAQQTFLNKHASDTVVMTCEVSSVNHLIAARRAMNGDNAFGGKTITEAVAEAYGESCSIANLGLAGGGYVRHGDDDRLAPHLRAEPITDPLMFAMAMHGFKGIKSPLTGNNVNAIRQLRIQMEAASQFQNDFKDHPLVSVYRKNREELLKSLEKGDMISKLMLIDPSSADLESFGIELSPDIEQIMNAFPQASSDPMESKTALAFLAAKNGLSNAFVISPEQSPLIDTNGTPNAPIAFDWSHVDHRGAQNAMWSYILNSLDSLIDLLKVTDIDGNPAKGKMWDRSMIYIATEFGRDKVSGGGSGHHLNNGVVLISPMLNGNRVYGGIDAATGITHGFDPVTGASDPNRKMNEKDIFGAITHAMGIDFEGRHDMPAMVR